MYAVYAVCTVCAHPAFVTRYLDRNQLTGGLPPQLGQLTSLQRMYAPPPSLFCATDVECAALCAALCAGVCAAVCCVLCAVAFTKDIFSLSTDHCHLTIS